MNKTKSLKSLMRKRPASRRQPRDIVEQNLTKLIQKEVKTGITEIFGSQATDNTQTRGRVHAGQQMPFDSRQAAINIDQMVASALTNGKQTTGILRSLFGLVPSLIGR